MFWTCFRKPDMYCQQQPDGSDKYCKRNKLNSTAEDGFIGGAIWQSSPGVDIIITRY